MSLDSSLKSGAGLARHRNVLTRTERLATMLANGRMEQDGAHILGMAKVSHRKLSVGKKTPKKTEETDDKKGKKKK